MSWECGVRGSSFGLTGVYSLWCRQAVRALAGFGPEFAVEDLFIF